MSMNEHEKFEPPFAGRKLSEPETRLHERQQSFIFNPF
jgi:hypothetical protein